MKKLFYNFLLLGSIFTVSELKSQIVLEALEGGIPKSVEEERLENYLATGDCRLLSRTKDVGLGVPDSSWYHVRLILPGGINVCYMHPPNDYSYIMDATEVVFPWLQLPYSGRAGSDGESAAKLLSGFVRQDQTFLNDKQLGDGYILLDASYPQTDVVIETHKAADVQ